MKYPKCGEKFVVVDDAGVAQTVWATLPQARFSCIYSGRPGWFVRSDVSGRVYFKMTERARAS